MALTPQEAAELKKQLQEIERLSRLLKKNIDTTSLKDVETHAGTIKHLFESLNEEFNDLTGEIGYAAANFKKLVQEVKNTNVGVNETTKSFNRLSSIAEKLQMHQKGIVELSSDEVKKLQKQLEIERKRLENNQNILEDKKASLELDKNDIALKIQNKLREASRKRANNDIEGYKAAMREVIKLKSEQTNINKEYTRTTSAITTNNNLLLDQDESLKAIEATAGGINDQLEKQNKLLGLGGVATEGIKTALDKLGFGGLVEKLGLDDAKKKMKETADEIIAARGDVNSLENKFKVLKSGLKSMGASLIENLKDPIVIATFLIKEFIDALISSDKATGELAKGMNMTYNDASALRQEMGQIANLSMDASVTTRGMQESYMAMGQSIGAQVDMNEANLVLMTKLREKAGLTNEEFISMSKIAAATGENVEDATKGFLGGAQAVSIQAGKALNVKQLMKETANVSNAIKLSIKGGVEGLGEAAAKAKLLGMNLEQADKIAGSLLNFEDSINAELEAELLTGKDLNLEAARLAAINGDMGKLTEEISKNIGSSADFTNMNRLQQEALAKAVGMTREELANTLVEQEALKTLGRDLTEEEQTAFEAAKEKYGVEKASKMLGEGQLDMMMKQQSVQERLNAAVEKLREVFISIADPLMQIISPIVDTLLPVLSIINAIIGAIGTAFSWVGEKIGALIPSLGIVGKILKWIAGVGVIYAAYQAFAMASVVPIVGPILGALAAAAVTTAGFGLLNGLSQPAGDISSPSDGKTRVSTKEGGLFELSPNDDFAAAPGLLDNLNKPAEAYAVNTSNGNGGNAISNTEMIAIMREILSTGKEQIKATKEIANQPVNINMDGEKVGEKSTFGVNNKNNKTNALMQ